MAKGVYKRFRYTDIPYASDKKTLAKQRNLEYNREYMRKLSDDVTETKKFISKYKSEIKLLEDKMEDKTYDEYNTKLRQFLRVDKNHWEIIVEAIKLFGKSKCFLCGVDLDWESFEKKSNNGRMYNIDNDYKLKEDNWVSLCVECNKRLFIKMMVDNHIQEVDENETV